MKAKEIELLYNEHFRSVAQLAYRIVGSVDIAEDIVHDVFVKLLEIKTTPNTSPKGMLFMMVRNSAIDYTRKQKKLSSKEDIEAHQLIDEYDIELEELEIEHAHNIEKLYSAIESLPPKSRSVVKLICLNKHTYKEASTKLDMSDNTIKTHMYRSMSTLKDIFNKLKK